MFPVSSLMVQRESNGGHDDDRCLATCPRDHRRSAHRQRLSTSGWQIDDKRASCWCYQGTSHRCALAWSLVVRDLSVDMRKERISSDGFVPSQFDQRSDILVNRMSVLRLEPGRSPGLSTHTCNAFYFAASIAKAKWRPVEVVGKQFAVGDVDPGRGHICKRLVGV